MELPGVSGRLGLMVATSKAGFTFVGIGFGGGGGSGIAQAVCCVALTKFKGSAAPCVNVPVPGHRLPVGVQVIGRFGDDGRALAVARMIEAALRG